MRSYQIETMHKKIAIIGNAGAGKSTLAIKLQNKLNLPLYHLDQYFWKPGWQEPDRNEFEKIHHKLCDQPSWIIEGMAIRFFEYRARQADIIIFLDVPTYKCFYRVFKRTIFNFGKVLKTSAPGCPERGPDLKFLKFIWNFNTIRKPLIESLLQKYQNQKQIYVVKNKKELQTLIKNFNNLL